MKQVLASVEMLILLSAFQLKLIINSFFWKIRLETNEIL